MLNDDFSACNMHKLFRWQQEFIATREKLAFITAANQIGKSSALILKNLNLAFRPELWPAFFGERRPRLFIYLYPDKETATTEYLTKWVPYLTQHDNDNEYPFEAHFKQKQIDRLYFPTTGINLVFRFYTQAPKNVQASTADLVSMDEECPQSHFDELMVRTQKTRLAGSGLVSMVFTATLGQQYLFDTMERQGSPQERFKNAFKRQISLYDCLSFADGSLNPELTVEIIENKIIPSFSSQAEIDRRVFGRFVKDAGLVYQFDSELNTEPYNWDLVKGWNFLIGIDYGLGGTWGHSSAIALVAVDHTYTKLRVVTSYHSQKRRMTQGDLLEIFKSRFQKYQANNYYDWHATDFGELAIREQIPMHKAEKSHDIGVGLLNTVLQTGQLKFFTGPESGDNQIIMQEMLLLDHDTPKKKALDDGCDAVRYSIAAQPIRITPLTDKKREEMENIQDPRMRFYKGLDKPNGETTPFGDYVEQSLEDAAAMFQEYGL